MMDLFPFCSSFFSQLVFIVAAFKLTEYTGNLFVEKPHMHILKSSSQNLVGQRRQVS